MTMQGNSLEDDPAPIMPQNAHTNQVSSSFASSQLDEKIIPESLHVNYIVPVEQKENLDDTKVEGIENAPIANQAMQSREKSELWTTIDPTKKKV